jgi:MFS family permease
MSWREKSFEVLPALSIRGDNLRKAMRLVTVAWMFGVVWQACFMGSQMNLFGNLLGFSNRDFGFYMAIGQAAFIFQIVSAVILERTGLRKYQFIATAFAHRVIWVLLIAVPVLFAPGRSAVLAFMSVYAVGSVLAHFSSPAWQNWMGDLVPRRIRGRYFATRSIWATPVQIVTVIATGLVLDYCTVQGWPEGTEITMQTQPVLIYPICGLFVIGAIFGLIDVFTFLRMREIVSPPLTGRQSRPRQGSRMALGEALMEPIRAVGQAVRDKNFLSYGLYAATITFAQSIGGSFFLRNALENLRYSKLWTNIIFMVAGAVSGMVMLRIWGRLVDRWGRRPVLMICTIGTVFSPVGWFVMPPGNMTAAIAIGAATCVFGGAAWSGVNLAMTSMILGFSEKAGRSKYIAAAAVFAAAGGLLGGLGGGELAEAFDHLAHNRSPLQVGPFLWNNWHLTFLASSAARALAVIWLIWMPDTGARPMREIFRHFRVNAYNNFLPRLFSWPWRARQGHRPGRPPLMKWLIGRPRAGRDRAA